MTVKTVLNRLKRYLGGKDVQLCQIDEKWFSGFLEWLKGGTEPSSANLYASVVRAALRLAARRNVIAKNPAADVPSLKTHEKKIVWLNAAELEALAGAGAGFPGSGEIKRAFLFACQTGLRVSDLRSLDWGDIDRSAMQVVKRQVKTGAQAYIPMNKTAWGLIGGGEGGCSGPVFPGLNAGKQFDYGIFRRWAESAGISKKIGWHTARHTFAVLALEGGTDIYTLSKLLGHTDVKTTQIYAKATDKMKRAAVDSLPELKISGVLQG
ncbi:MAG: site-specific integrase [Treponema sp.]|nr:site-specific integrase [Treponema sp.]